jgi:hypothetical protein
MSVAPLAILGGLSTAMQAFGSVSAGNAQAASLNADAAASDDNAQLAEIDGAQAGEAIRREARQVEGEAVARMGANGISLGTGSALEALRESAYRAEYDVLVARYDAATQARAYRVDAANKRAAARGAKRAGYIGAAASIISGATSAYAGARAAAAGAAVRDARRPVSGMAMPIPAVIGAGGAGGGLLPTWSSSREPTGDWRDLFGPGGRR